MCVSLVKHIMRHCCCARLQEATHAALQLVQLENQEEQLQEDPAAKLTKVGRWQHQGPARAGLCWRYSRHVLSQR